MPVLICKRLRGSSLHLGLTDCVAHHVLAHVADGANIKSHDNDNFKLFELSSVKIVAAMGQNDPITLAKES